MKHKPLKTSVGIIVLTTSIIIIVLNVAIIRWLKAHPVYSIKSEVAKVEVKAEEESFSIFIQTDAPFSEWELSCSEPWVKLSKNPGHIDVVCESNVKAKRTAVIRLICRDPNHTEDSVKLIQAEGHESVDLGLGVKWATCNVGASTPEDYGEYFSWGQVYSKPRFTFDTCLTYGESISDIAGSFYYDVAYSRWGVKWRMPTKDDIIELMNHCTTEWTESNGVKGCKFTSKKNGASLFFPAAGYQYGSSPSGVGEFGFIWSSTPHEKSSEEAFGLFFGREGLDWGYGVRLFGHSVRPVREK